MVKTEQDYFAALKRIEELWGAKKDSSEGDELDLLVTLVESYKKITYPESGKNFTQGFKNTSRSIAVLK